MIKLNTTQARAIAHRIIETRNANWNKEQERITSEIKASRETSIMRDRILELIDQAMTVYENCNTGSVVLQLWGDYIYVHTLTDDNYIKAADGALQCYINAMVTERMGYHSYIREDDLVQDIIFESIQCDDVNELVNKFVNKYND